jgi:hypothetical protein
MLAGCVVLAACDSSSSREITGPTTPALFDEAAVDNGLGLSPDGPFDQVFATEDPSAQQAATGGQALGHIGFAFNPPALGIIIDEKYEFAALNIEPLPPFTAKGELEVHLHAVTVQNTVHSDVICMTVVGNRARIAARVELLFVNGVMVPPGERYNVWTVVDNGEGMETDTGSLMFFTPSLATALAHCNTGFALAAFPNQEGNVQVSP